jgi:hypothetical protein
MRTPTTNTRQIRFCLLLLGVVAVAGSLYGGSWTNPFTAPQEPSPCIDNHDGTVTDTSTGLIWQQMVQRPAGPLARVASRTR